MNVLLLQCTRAVSVIGVEEKEREECIDVVTRGAKVFREEDMEVATGEHTGHGELAELVSRKRIKVELEEEMEDYYLYGRSFVERRGRGKIGVSIGVS